MRGILPFFFCLTSALGSGFQHGLLNSVNNRVGIVARGQDQGKFIPKPLSRSGKIEVVALDSKAIGESDTPSGRMARVSPVTCFKQDRMKHSELSDFSGYSVNFHPIT